ncbi:unnamed protein product [Rotaria sp. Silwood1]|nr:unnamed protein product [Rotaria sp. Silwood1]
MVTGSLREPLVDPTRTIPAGKVNIGAFCTYAEGYKAENEMIDYQAIPLNKTQDFGVHYKKYYPLEASFFKSSLDKRLLEHLWNRYCYINIVKKCRLLADQINHVVNKLQQAKRHLGRTSFRPLLEQDRKQDDILAKAVKDSTETAIEVINSFMSQLIKQRLFN